MVKGVYSGSVSHVHPHRTLLFTSAHFLELVGNSQHHIPVAWLKTFEASWLSSLVLASTGRSYCLLD